VPTQHRFGAIAAVKELTKQVDIDTSPNAGVWHARRQPTQLPVFRTYEKVSPRDISCNFKLVKVLMAEKLPFLGLCTPVAQSLLY
jgi:hypothetical protein